MHGHFITNGLRRLNRHYQSSGGITPGPIDRYEWAGTDFLEPDGNAHIWARLHYQGADWFFMPSGELLDFGFSRVGPGNSVGNYFSGGNFFSLSGGGNVGMYLSGVADGTGYGYSRDVADWMPSVKNCVVIWNASKKWAEVYGKISDDCIPTNNEIQAWNAVNYNYAGSLNNAPQPFGFVAPDSAEQYAVDWIGETIPTDINSPIGAATVARCIMPHYRTAVKIRVYSSAFDKLDKIIERFGGNPIYIESANTSPNINYSASEWRNLVTALWGERANQILKPVGSALVESQRYIQQAGTTQFGVMGWQAGFGQVYRMGNYYRFFPACRIYSRNAVNNVAGTSSPTIYGQYLEQKSQSWFLQNNRPYIDVDGTQIIWDPVTDLSKLECVRGWHL